MSCGPTQATCELSSGFEPKHRKEGPSAKKGERVWGVGTSESLEPGKGNVTVHFGPRFSGNGLGRLELTGWGALVIGLDRRHLANLPGLGLERGCLRTTEGRL